MTENSLALIERASLMLAEANTIQATKGLKDLMLTASDWAKRRGMGGKGLQSETSPLLLSCAPPIVDGAWSDNEYGRYR